jgi:hypothetical protein
LHNSLRFTPASVAKQSEGDLVIGDEFDNALKARMQGGLASSELETVSVGLDRGQSMFPLFHRQRGAKIEQLAICTLFDKDIAASLTAIVAEGGQLQIEGDGCLEEDWFFTVY